MAGADSVGAAVELAVLMLLSALINEKAFNYFLGIATLAFFTTYLLQTIGLLVATSKGRIPVAEPGTFDLGRARKPVLVVSLVVFILVEAALLFLPAFAGNGFVFAGLLALALLWWLVVLRRRLQGGLAGPRYATQHPDELPTAEQLT